MSELSVTAAVADPAPDRPRRIVAPTSASDKIFRGVLRVSGLAVFVIMGLIAAFLALRSAKAFRLAGWRFLTEQKWQISGGQFGIASILPNGIIIALIALLLSVPVSLGAAVFISEYAPTRLRRFLISAVDLMAAIPSIVYGIWGVYFLMPHYIGIIRWTANHFGFIPILDVPIGDQPSSYTQSAFIAGTVLGLMITPIIISLAREVYSQAPQGEREAAYALGATRWGMIRSVVLPYGRGGAIGAVMLGFGRAMGETITIALIITPIYTVGWHVLQTGGLSVSALIALNYSEASGASLAGLMAAGLVLFVITLVVNMLAAVVISRSRSGVQSD